MLVRKVAIGSLEGRRARICFACLRNGAVSGARDSIRAGGLRSLRTARVDFKTHFAILHRAFWAITSAFSPAGE